MAEKVGMKRMTIADIRALGAHVPPPDSSVALLGARFDIYTAKKVFNRSWEHPALHRLVREARRTYLRYGDVPLADEYDKKAIVYVVRVAYDIAVAKQERIPVEEWLSIRFIPAHGLPASSEDLEQYEYRGKTVRHWMQKNFFSEGEEALDHMVTMSRICGIAPYYARQADEDRLALTLDPKHRYTAAAFALLNNAFLAYCGKHGLPYRYITCVMRTELMRKVLTVRRGPARSGFVFVPVHRMLGCPRKRDVQLNRGMLAYQFPGYYLDVSQLLELLQGLVRSGKISNETIQAYARISGTLAECVAAHRSSYVDLLTTLRGLGRLLTIRGKLRGSQLTGSELRALVDAHVKDGPCLYIMDTSSWKKTIEHFLTDVRV